jgi:hypothetical protein
VQPAQKFFERMVSPRHIAFWGLLASIATVVGLLVTIGLALTRGGGGPAAAGTGPTAPSFGTSQTQPVSAQPASSNPVATASSPSPPASTPNDSLAPAVLWLADSQTLSGYGEATDAQISATDYVKSVQINCSPLSFHPTAVWNAAGYRQITAVFGISDDTSGAANATANIIIANQDDTRLTAPFKISLGHPRRLSVDLRGAVQVSITCVSVDNRNASAERLFRATLGDGTLSP